MPPTRSKSTPKGPQIPLGGPGKAPHIEDSGRRHPNSRSPQIPQPQKLSAKFKRPERNTSNNSEGREQKKEESRNIRRKKQKKQESRLMEIAEGREQNFGN